MLKFNELKEFLEENAKEFNINIIKYAKWIQNGHINLDILIENTQTEYTNLTDCSKISSLTSNWLKNENLANKTNVCIRVPGLDRELFSIEDLNRFKNEEIKFFFKYQINGRKQIKGFIKNIECDLITIEEKGKELQFQWDSIHKAQIVPNWTQIMKQANIRKI